MNYIKEINAFYQRQETNQLSSSAANLWHALMHINNRAHWIEEFSVAAAVICCKAGLSNSTFKRARAELRKKGYITYTSRGTKAPLYKIVSLIKGEVADPKKEQKDEEVSQDMDQAVHQAPNQVVSPLYKQDEIKQKETKTSSYQFYCENFGKPNNYIRKEMIMWSKQVGEELLSEALTRALDNGTATWHYVKGILTNWKKDNLRTTADVLRSEERYRKKRMLKHRQHNTDVPEEIVPDWFRELKEEQRKERELRGRA